MTELGVRCFRLITILISTIWNGVFVMKVRVIMALQISKADPVTMTLHAFGQDVLGRRAALGTEINMPGNSGTRRTESKKALLKATEDAGGKW